MRSTQRCESMNRTLKKVLDQKIMLYRFVQLFDASIKDMRFDNGTDDFTTLYSEPVLTGTLCNIKKHAASIYTRKSYQILCKEMEAEAMFVVVEVAEESSESTGNQQSIFIG